MIVRRNLTDRKVKSLRRDLNLEDKLGHYDTWDALTPGLGIRTSKTGRRTFVLMARYPGSRNPTRQALGVYGELTLEQAREKARRWLELIRKGIDPAAAEEEARQAALRLQANIFAAVAEERVRFGEGDLDYPGSQNEGQEREGATAQRSANGRHSGNLEKSAALQSR
jgi:Arm DNA-binding domain